MDAPAARLPEGRHPERAVSIDPARDAAWHNRVGRALSALRDEGVLLIGPGRITHNLRAFFSMMRQGLPLDPTLPWKVEAFTSCFAERLSSGDTAALLDWKPRAPHPAENH